MLIRVLRAKIHRAVITAADKDYIGSITIDPDLIDAVGILPGECVLVADINNAARFETYVLAGERGSATVCVNGAAAGLVEAGHRVIVMAWAQVSLEEARTMKAPIIVLDEGNRIQQRL